MKYSRIAAVLAAAALATGVTACKPAEKPAETAAAETAETEKAAIVGSWQLVRVLVSEKEGDEMVEVQAEDHASMFAEQENVYTFNEDGTGTLLVVDGADKVELPAAWKTNDDGSYTVTADVEEVYLYDPVDDVLMREFITDNPYIHVLTVFGRQ